MADKYYDMGAVQAFYDKIKTIFQTVANKVTSWSSTPSDDKYPSEKLVKNSLDGKVSSIKKNGSTITPSSGVADIGYVPVTESQSSATVQNLIQALRIKPGGRMGSANVQTSTVGSTSIPGAWYNYIWIPHQNGSATSDYQNYGTLLLSPLTTAPQLYIVEGSALNGSTPTYRATLIKEDHSHYWFKSEAPSKLQNVNDYYQCISASISDFAGLVKLYDVTEFFDGTIVNQGERSVFFGDVSLIRDGGNAGCKYARVCAMIGYASSQVILQSDDDNAYPVLVKEDFERLEVSGTVGAYVISNNVATLDTTKTKAKYFVVDCSEYSRVFINAGFYNASGIYGDAVKAYIFANDEGSVLGNSTGPNFDGYVDVPAGATKLYLHTNSGYSQVSVGPTTTAPKYFLAMRYVNGWPAGKIEYFGRFYTRVTASASFKARPLLLTYVQCFQPVGSASIPTGYVIQKSASYTTHANSANKLATARQLAVSLSNTSTNTTFDGSANVTNIKITGTLGIGNGGTGATTKKAAEYAINGGMSQGSGEPQDSYQFVFSRVGSDQSETNGVFLYRTAATIWSWIKGKISSVLGLSESGYTGNAATASAAETGSTLETTINSKANESEGVYYVAGSSDYVAYSASSTYTATTSSGPFTSENSCTYGGKAYFCKTAITTPEAWTSAHWTAIATPVLTGTIDGLTSLYAGLKIAYKMSITGGSSATYLNINNLGNKYIRRNDSNLTTHLSANTVVFLAYDGTYWRWADYDSNTNNWVTTMGAYCETDAATQAKTATSTYTVYTAGEAFLIRIVNANTYNGKITLNINGQGAKDVWINGAISSSSNKTLPAGEHWCYYDGSVFHIWTDGTAEFKNLKAETFTGNVSGTASNAEGYTNVGGIATALDGKVPTGRNVNGKALSADITLNAADVSAIPTSASGVSGGVATLDADGKVPTEQLPALQSLTAGTDLKITSNVISINTDGTVANSTKMPFVAGSATYAAGIGAAAFGYKTSAVNNYSFAEGSYTSAAGEESHAEGGYTSAVGTMSHAEGGYTITVGNYSHAEGQNTRADGHYSHTEGQSTSANGNHSHAEGSGTSAVGSASHAEGYSAIASGDYSHAEGSATRASGDASHAEGISTKASGDGSHSEGYYTSASGDASHAEGSGTRTSGDASHAEGFRTSAIGNYSHAEGSYTNAFGNNSHAEGVSSYASSYESHAEGRYTSAIYGYSHAEGKSSIASGYAAHAEGWETIATGYASHAEGISAYAKGSAAHAEGYGASAQANYSHAEGISACAKSSAAHAEGYRTSAVGNYSHAEGLYTITNSDAMHAGGKYNKTSSDALFVIGNGSADDARSDAFIVYDNGAAYVQDTQLNAASSATMDYTKTVHYIPHNRTLTIDPSKLKLDMNYMFISNKRTSGSAYGSIQFENNTAYKLYGSWNSANFFSGTTVSGQNVSLSGCGIGCLYRTSAATGTVYMGGY